MNKNLLRSEQLEKEYQEFIESGGKVKELKLGELTNKKLEFNVSFSAKKKRVTFSADGSALTYKGSRCRRCNNHIRYVSSRSCVDCSRASANAVKAKGLR